MTNLPVTKRENQRVLMTRAEMTEFLFYIIGESGMDAMTIDGLIFLFSTISFVARKDRNEIGDLADEMANTIYKETNHFDASFNYYVDSIGTRYQKTDYDTERRGIWKTITEEVNRQYIVNSGEQIEEASDEH